MPPGKNFTWSVHIKRKTHIHIPDTFTSWHYSFFSRKGYITGNITNGRFTQYKEVYQYSEVVIYRCNPSNGPDEYSLIGETTLICVDHNRWSSDPPECKGNNISMYFLLNLKTVETLQKYVYLQVNKRFPCNCSSC